MRKTGKSQTYLSQLQVGGGILELYFFQNIVWITIFGVGGSDMYVHTFKSVDSGIAMLFMVFQVCKLLSPAGAWDWAEPGNIGK